MNWKEACTTPMSAGTRKSMNRHTSSGINPYAIISNNHVYWRMKYRLIVGGSFLFTGNTGNTRSVVFAAFSVPCFQFSELSFREKTCFFCVACYMLLLVTV